MRISDRRRRRPAPVVALSAVALLVVATLGAADWEPVEPGYGWSFPQDHWAHPEQRLEWWYLTGNLVSTSPPGREFGFQFTFFRIGLLPEAREMDSDWNARQLIMGHASLTDITGGGHRFSEVLYREVPLLGEFDRPPGPRVAWCRAPAGTPGIWQLDWNGAGFDLTMDDRRQRFALELSTRPGKPMTLQGQGGFSRKADEPGVASQYYSFTRLDTVGTVTLDGESFRVSGVSWMDHEFGTGRLGSRQVGWDWFGLQLDDGRELMLARLRRADGSTDFASGTLIGSDGTTAVLGGDDFRLHETGRWTSAASGVTYPRGFRIELPGQNAEWTIEPRLQDQENASRLGPALDYWEGAVIVRDRGGRTIGRGYAELTGYGDANRPSF